MRYFRDRFRAGVLWAMIPLALVSGRSVPGCICADGHYEPFCSAHRSPIGRSDDQGQPANAIGCTHACCARPAEPRPHISGQCCHAHQQARGPRRQAAMGNECCTAIAQAPVIAATDMEVSDEDFQTGLASVTAIQAIDATSIAGPTMRYAQDTGPPIDLVVTLRRLLI